MCVCYMSAIEISNTINRVFCGNLYNYCNVFMHVCIVVIVVVAIVVIVIVVVVIVVIIIIIIIKPLFSDKLVFKSGQFATNQKQDVTKPTVISFFPSISLLGTQV